MEEDIKILEELTKGFDNLISYNQKQAIQNLIARYKETKQELESVKEIYYTQKEIETNYIPKSKVQERIEELKECCKNCNFRGSICKDFKAFNQCTFQVTIKNLQGLLED